MKLALVITVAVVGTSQHLEDVALSGICFPGTAGDSNPITAGWHSLVYLGTQTATWISSSLQGNMDEEQGGSAA